MLQRIEAEMSLAFPHRRTPPCTSSSEGNESDWRGDAVEEHHTERAQRDLGDPTAIMHAKPDGSAKVPVGEAFHHAPFLGCSVGKTAERYRRKALFASCCGRATVNGTHSIFDTQHHHY
jgi:hypothetical protein